MERGAPAGEKERAPTTFVILPCPSCRRSVRVFGRMRRVLCACGEILMEIGREPERA